MVAPTCWMCPWMKSSTKMAWLSVFDQALKLLEARPWSVIPHTRQTKWKKSVKSFVPSVFFAIPSAAVRTHRLAPFKSSFLKNKCNVTMVRLVSLSLDFVFYSSICSDIYVCAMGQSNMVTPKDWYVALVSTTVETNNPENEIKPGLQLLEPIYQKWA